MNEFDKFILTQIPPAITSISKKVKGDILTDKNPAYTKIASQQARISNKIKEAITKPGTIVGRTSSDKNILLFNELIQLGHIAPFEGNIETLRKSAPKTHSTLDSIFYYIDKVENHIPFTPEQQEWIRVYDRERKSLKKKMNEFPVQIQETARTLNSYQSDKTRCNKAILEYFESNNLTKIASEIDVNNLKSSQEEGRRQLKKTQVVLPERKAYSIHYYRYADDWIIIVRGPKTIAKYIRKRAERWLMEYLSLELSVDKSRITDLFLEKARFLGFEIYHQTNKQFKRIQRDGSTYVARVGVIQISPDKDRLLNKFRMRNYVRENLIPRSVGFLTPLQDHQIIEKFNQFMIGIGNYYIIEITRPSDLNRWHYYLYYSCLMTLAHKHKTTIAKLYKFTTYLDLSDPRVDPKMDRQVGYNQRFIASYTIDQGTDKARTIYKVLHNYQEFMMRILRLRKQFRFQKNETANKQGNTVDFITFPIDFNTLHKANWRTRFRLHSLCAVCGSDDRVQMHHLEKIRKGPGRYTGFKGFDKLVAALGRKQIPLCFLCHRKHHSGKLDGLNLTDLFDIRLVAPESLLKVKLPKTQPETSVDNKIDKTTITIDENRKTYFNSELRRFYEERRSASSPEKKLIPLAKKQLQRRHTLV
jgi:hypothetical protein